MPPLAHRSNSRCWSANRAARNARAPTLLQGPLAHRVEQGTFNPKVPGSSPGRPTRISPGQRDSAAVPLLRSRVLPNRKPNNVGGGHAGKRAPAAACDVVLPEHAHVFSRDPDGKRPWVPNDVTEDFIRVRKTVKLVRLTSESRSHGLGEVEYFRRAHGHRGPPASLSPGPRPHSAAPTDLSSVSCPSADFCVAVDCVLCQLPP